MSTEEDEAEFDPLASLPSLPFNIDKGGAGLWAGVILMKAAQERGWDSNDVRALLMTLLVTFSHSTATDEELHVELQSALDRARARRSVKQ